MYCYIFLTSDKNKFKGSTLTPKEAEIEYDLSIAKALSQPEENDRGSTLFAIFIIVALILIIYLRYF